MRDALLSPPDTLLVVKVVDYALEAVCVKDNQQMSHPQCTGYETSSLTL